MEHVHDSEQFLNKRDKSRIVHGVWEITGVQGTQKLNKCLSMSVL